MLRIEISLARFSLFILNGFTTDGRADIHIEFHTLIDFAIISAALMPVIETTGAFTPSR
jgi:hypothetical protein